MKTIQQIQFKEDLLTTWDVCLKDFMVVIWFYVVVWLIGYIFL